MVFQHFSLFENLTVAENVALGLAPTDTFAAISARLAEVSRIYGLPLDPKREVWRLSVGERQRIEIVRALMQNPKLLILDEPTAVLTPQEADQLFVVLERLKSEGRAILYISHKLDEVKRLCDTATILRGGKKVATCDPRRETAASLARMMVGGEIGEVKAAIGPRDSGAAADRAGPHARAGRSAWRAARTGLASKSKAAKFSELRASPATGRTSCLPRSPANGSRRSPSSVVIDGQRRRPPLDHRAAPARRGVRAGGAARPRHRAADEAFRQCAAHRPCRERRWSSHGFIDKAATLAVVDRTTTAFDVRKAKRDPEAVSLSGGNLQKFVVGREILREPGVLIVSQPTWGVDAGRGRHHPPGVDRSRGARQRPCW